MSFLGKVDTLGPMLLRALMLFFIDQIFKIQVNYPELKNDVGQIMTHNIYEPLWYRMLLVYLFRLEILAIVCLATGFMLTTSSKHLISAYAVLSVGVLFSWIFEIVNPKPNIGCCKNETIHLLHNILALNFEKLFTQKLYISWCKYTYMQQALKPILIMNVYSTPKNLILGKLLRLTFLIPLGLAFSTETFLLNHAPILVTLLHLPLVNYVVYLVPGTRKFIVDCSRTRMLRSKFPRLEISHVLRTFWVLRILVALFFFSGQWNRKDGISKFSRLLKYSSVVGCETFVAILGTASIVSYICQFIGTFLKWILFSDRKCYINFESVSFMMFFSLALQNDLTHLEPELRFVMICRNMWILFISLLHFIHQLVNPLLVNVVTSQNLSLKKHSKILLVSGVVITVSFLIMYFIFKTVENNIFLFGTFMLCIEVIMKFCVSVVIYTLNMIYIRKQTFWENFDSYTYFVRAFGNIFEIFVGISLLFNGLWSLFFEFFNVIRAIKLGFYIYLNIWCKARVGWFDFINRRRMIRSIKGMLEASNQQLDQLGDVCAVCYHEMQHARVTECGHFFHGVCLRKWLDVDNRCPLCQKFL